MSSKNIRGIGLENKNANYVDSIELPFCLMTKLDSKNSIGHNQPERSAAACQNTTKSQSTIEQSSDIESTCNNGLTLPYPALSHSVVCCPKRALYLRASKQK